jgi:hypothetical protein
VQTGAAVGPGLGALVYAGLYAVLPEAIAWRALPAQGMISIASRRTLNPLLEIEFGVAILRQWQFIPRQC